MSRRGYREGFNEIIRHIGHNLTIVDNETVIELKCNQCNNLTGWRWVKPKEELTLREYLGALFWGVD